MVVPLAMLAILAFVVIRSLMGVVAHDDAAPARTAFVPEAAAPAIWGDDARAFLLPAADAPAVDADADATTERVTR